VSYKGNKSSVVSEEEENTSLDVESSDDVA
jgi:hypothetical protein